MEPPDICVDDESSAGLRTRVAALPLAERVTHLGAHGYPAAGEDKGVAFGFYLPGTIEAELILYRARTPLDPVARPAVTEFYRVRIPLHIQDDFSWTVLTGVRNGSRQQTGDLYWVRYRRSLDEPMHILRDPLAHSVPFGASGPAEVYELSWPGRTDSDYFASRVEQSQVDTRVGVPRLAGPAAILQIHVATATESGSFAGLTRLFSTLADKVETGAELSPLEHSLSSYDAVQLMPIEPTIEYEATNGFWAETAIDDGVVRAEHSRPDMTNWGYDIMTIGSPAVNPALLESGRPDEFIDFLEVMHQFPGGGIKVILDIVYGHADNQSQPLLQSEFIAGPGMYGQVLDYQQPVVREILLEMQRRKSSCGIDGLRVDGAQDFTYFDARQQRLLHDDDYLQRMNDQVIEIQGSRFLPWMIFEDGRPWPDDDWELSSTYREVTKKLPNVLQWGPLTFAHNTPFLYTFWAQKWWRVRESFLYGGSWITGCANHDTLRRGTQVDPEERINSRLGGDHREIFRRGYNNPAAQLLAYGAMPGVPMDFLQANIGAPWSFIRNTDDRWAIKVVSEESRFLTWAVDDALYAREDFFKRLKGFGFVTLEPLRSFMHHLDLAMRAAEYHRETAVRILDAAVPNSPLSPHTIPSLNAFARAWMDDLHEYCSVSRWTHSIDHVQTSFHRELREFRRAYPFLAQSIDPRTEAVRYLEPCEGSVVYIALRRDPESDLQLLFAANMEGQTHTVALSAILDVLQRDLGTLPATWDLLLQTPGAKCVDSLQQHFRLPDSEGIIMVAKREMVAG